MFSGIVETLGTIQRIKNQDDCLTFQVTPHQPLEDLNLGDSVSLNGVCLTITHLEENSFCVMVAPQTLRVTNLGTLSIGQQVNLERAIQLNQRLGGHYVQGHIDGVGEMIALKPDGDGALLAEIKILPSLGKYIIDKGYIAIDGMSITVIQAHETYFHVMFIPYTRSVTIVSQYQIGTQVNIEVDILGKYVEKLLSTRQS